MLRVSRESSSVDGQKLCSCGCGRPRDRAGQRYRRDCHTEYMRSRRAGMVERLLSPAEWELIRELRKTGAGALRAAGRHHREN